MFTINANANSLPAGTHNATITFANLTNGQGTTTRSVMLTVTPPADTEAPSAPTNLVASAVSSSQINLSWNASTDNIGVAGYRVFRNGAQVAAPTGTSYSDTGLSASTQYTHTIRAVDLAGNVSDASGSTSATTVTPADAQAPSAPTNLVASAVSSSQINVSWSASTDNVGVAGHRVFRNGAQVAAPTGTSYSDTGLSASTQYTYTVRAVDFAGNVSNESGSTSATTSPPAGVNCDLYATTANFGSQVSAASPGQIVCLASGNYGTWSGTNKAIAIKATPGATPQMKFNFSSGDSGFTLDGMSGMGGSISGSASNITIKNSTFTSQVAVTGNGAGIVFDGNTHNNISGHATAHRFLAAGPVTIRNSRLEGGGADGVRLATSAQVVIEDNLFLNIIDDGSGNHTDMIQWYGGSNAIVRRNLFKQTVSGETQVMGAYDGTGGNLIEDNVIDVTGRNAGIELYSDDGSIVRHNTVVYRSPCPWSQPCGFIDLNRKSSNPAGRNTEVNDNIATAVTIQAGSTAARRDHNMVRQNAGSGDFVGVPIFVGGASPTDYAGYKLAPGASGKGQASDGLDVGARIADVL
jgi:chitodextrinase